MLVLSTLKDLSNGGDGRRLCSRTWRCGAMFCRVTVQQHRIGQGNETSLDAFFLSVVIICH